MGGTRQAPRCRGGRPVSPYPIDRRLRLCARVGTQHLFSVKPALAPAGARSGPESRPFGLRSRLSKAAQPRSSEKNAASRAGQTPCTRRAVEILLTKARKSVTAANRAFEEKQPLVFTDNSEAWYVDQDTKLRHVQEEVCQILIRTVRGGFEHLLNQVRTRL